jgi:hypothetical protein
MVGSSNLAGRSVVTECYPQAFLNFTKPDGATCEHTKESDLFTVWMDWAEAARASFAHSKMPNRVLRPVAAKPENACLRVLR